MGLRVSDSLVKTATPSPTARTRPPASGASTPPAASSRTPRPPCADADIVVLAVPDLALGPVTADIVPQLKPARSC